MSLRPARACVCYKPNLESVFACGAFSVTAQPLRCISLWSNLCCRCLVLFDWTTQQALTGLVAAAMFGGRLNVRSCLQPRRRQPARTVCPSTGAALVPSSVTHPSQRSLDPAMPRAQTAAAALPLSHSRLALSRSVRATLSWARAALNRGLANMAAAIQRLCLVFRSDQQRSTCNTLICSHKTTFNCGLWLDKCP